MKYRAYGRTWWGRAWIETLVGSFMLDSDVLTQGRAHARGNHVTDLNVDRGVIDALVQGDRLRPYAVTITAPVLTEAKWDRLLDTLAGRVGYVAALLDGDLPPDLSNAEDLVPSRGEVHITCSCAHPAPICEHAAAVGYLTAEIFDADACALLLLRGRTKAAVLSELRGRRQLSWSSPAGMLASDAYRREIAALPAPVPPPRRPGPPGRLAADPPAASGVSAEELSELAARAAHRAWDLLKE
jgi:uncharacterized Zn finger protein